MSSSDETPKDSPQTPSSTSSPCATCGKRGETSPDASASQKQKIDDNTTTIEFIEEFLECSICLEFPSSPIHSCDNAHFLCSQCAPKFSACPTCQCPKLSPNPACDKLAREANKKIDCANLEIGCKEGVLSTKFVDHLSSRCYFREITCNGSYDEDCGLKVKFHEYTNHLEDEHNEWIHFEPGMTETYGYNEEEHAKHGNVLHHWSQLAIKFANHEFIVHAQVSKQSQLFFAYVSVLGDKDLADKYICDVSFKDLEASNALGFTCSWKLPVLPFHEIPRTECEAKLFGYSGGSAVASAPMAALRKWGKLNEDWLLIEVNYEIKDA